MAHSLSAEKRIRQNATCRARNRWRKEQIKQAVHLFDEALNGGDTEKAAQQLKLCYKRIDMVAAKGTIHKNTAARKKARLAKAFNKATA